MMKDNAVSDLASLMRNRRTVVLSGAGISTESGIPDYRGPQGSLRTRRPILYREFVESAAARRRYWARSAAGWALVRDAKPNRGHEAVARLEVRDAVRGVITQNVDRLHQAAGSRRVLELHGALAGARCMSCGHTEARGDLQERLVAANPGWGADGPEAAPDGDAEVDAGATDGFSVPACLYCGGVLRPDVVFFGENVPVERVEAAARMVDEADVLLVAGSSLAVFSGYRFVQRAAAKGIPVAVLNQGPTRGDSLAALRIDRPLGDVLPELVTALEP
jgi:NAD+-dependent protein deacetylase sirtuin 4